LGVVHSLPRELRLQQRVPVPCYWMPTVVQAKDGIPVTTAECADIGYDASRHTPWRHAVAIVTMFCFFTYFYTLPLLPLLLLYAFHAEHWVLFAALTVLISTAFWPDIGPLEGLKRSFVWDTWRGYFNFRKVVLYEPEVLQKYMWVEYPHAIFPIGSILTGTYHDSSMLRLLASGRKVCGLAASASFRVPLLRQFLLGTGLVSATKHNFMSAFETSGTCAVLPGGIAEMFLNDNDPATERIYLRSRFGFVKVAIESGANLVPIYYFGNTQCFRGLSSTGLLKRLSRQLRMSLVLFHGRWGLPIPYQHPIIAVVGKPIHVVQTANPSKELIQEYHTKVVRAIQELFDSHKHLVGWQNKALVIE
jgi:1-acyl-sn-glycerol-3-phosphate acyltransferase